MGFRSSASFGKRQEYIAVAELLRRGHDVYLTLVDDQQIDCVLRLESDGEPEYLDIQIKARSKDCAPTNAGRFAAMEIRKPRNKFFFIFYSEQAETYWVIPSLELIKEANRNKEGVNKGKYSINFCNVTSKGVIPRPRFAKYQNAFHLLTTQPEAQSEQPQKDLAHARPHVNIIPVEKPKEKQQQTAIRLSGNLSCWAEVKKLVGKILETLDQHKKFKIIALAENHLQIKLESSGKKRSIQRKEIDKAFNELGGARELSRTDIELNFSPRNPAYVAAIFAKMPGVSYTVRPIILRYG